MTNRLGVLLDLTTAFRDASLRLVIAVAIIAAGLMASVGWYGHRAFRDALTDQAADSLDASTERLAGRISEVIALARHELTVLAGRPDLPAFLHTAGAGATGAEAADEMMLDGLLRHPVLNPYLLHLALVDPNGGIVQASGVEDAGRALPATDWFDEALEGERQIRTAWTSQAQPLAVDMTAVVPGENGPLGLIWARLGLQPIVDHKDDSSGGERTVIAARNWRNDAVILWPPSSASSPSSPQAIRPTRTERPIVTALRGEARLLRDGAVDEAGMPVIAAVRYLKTLDWGIVREQRYDDILAPAARLARDLLLGGGLLLGLAMLIVAKLGHLGLQSLRRLASQADVVLQSLVDGVLIADKHGRILTVNPAAAAMFGWQQDALIGESVEILMPPTARDAHARAVDRFRHERTSTLLGSTRELDGMRRDGAVFPIELALNTLKLDRRTQFIAIMRDISEREEARQQIARQAAELSQINSQLERRNEDLQKQFQGAHQFVDNVSHEFRTPLTVIKEYVEIMRDGTLGPLNEEQTEFAEVVLQRAEDLNIMVNDMLDISKLNAGLLGISRRRCPFGTIAGRCRPVLESRAKAAGIDLQFDIPSGLPELFADREKISRIIINLAVNAFKFTGEGGQVRIWGRDDGRAAQLIVGVTDNGPGIAPDNLKAIFERFRQVGDVRQSTKGFGLGLAITKELVDLSLGDISVESRPGEGSTFWFTIPTAEPLPLLERFISRLGLFRKGTSHLGLISIDAAAASTSQPADQLDAIILHTLRSSDLCLRVAPAKWLIVAEMNQSDASNLHYRLEREIGEAAAAGGPGDAAAAAVNALGTWPIAGNHDVLRACFAEQIAIDSTTVQPLMPV
ncbi:MAG: ATP-binding protein [Alphaproteobacteria bacterium]